MSGWGPPGKTDGNGVGGSIAVPTTSHLDPCWSVVTTQSLYLCMSLVLLSSFSGKILCCCLAGAHKQYRGLVGFPVQERRRKTEGG